MAGILTTAVVSPVLYGKKPSKISNGNAIDLGYLILTGLPTSDILQLLQLLEEQTTFTGSEKDEYLKILNKIRQKVET